MSDEAYAVRVDTPGSVLLLRIAIILTLIVSTFSLLGGLSTWDIGAIAGGLAGIVFAFLLIALSAIIDKLASIDAHMKTLLVRLSSRV